MLRKGEGTALKGASRTGASAKSLPGSSWTGLVETTKNCLEAAQRINVDDEAAI